MPITSSQAQAQKKSRRKRDYLSILTFLSLSSLLLFGFWYSIVQVQFQLKELSVNYNNNDEWHATPYREEAQQQKQTKRKEDDTKGFAACLLVLEDHMMLTEWIAYHYTTLPLRSLIIGLDPKNTEASIETLYKISSLWKNHSKLNITIWDGTHFANFEDCAGLSRSPPCILSNLRKIKRITYHRRNWQVHQRDLYIKCMEEHKRNNFTWVINTDLDEFITYNHIKPNENYSRYEIRHAGNKKPIEFDEQRKMSLPIRKTFGQFQNKTVESFLNYRKDVFNHTFPPCVRLLGLFFGNITSPGEENNILVSQRFRNHEKVLNGLFSKAMLDVSRIDYEHFTSSNWNTIHNPLLNPCGRNGPYCSGVDYIAAIFRFNHYIGPLEYHLKRDADRREEGPVNRYINKNKQYQPYDPTPDYSIDYWVDAFKDDVGHDNANILLFDALRTLQNNTYF